MRRKYIGRIGNSDPSSKENSHDNEFDPFEAKNRRFSLSNKESGESPDSSFKINNLDDTENELKNTTEFLKATSEEFKERLERIAKIKKLHENFDEEIRVLQGQNPTKENEDNNNAKEEEKSNIINLGDEITTLLTKSSEQKIKILELQLETEKKRTAELNSIIKENMNQIVNVEKELRSKLGHDVTTLVETNGKQKIKVMELQLENEKNHSQKIQNQVNDNLSKIKSHDKEIRKQRDKLEVEVQEKTQKLIQAERLSAIGELAARVAHDLRNPLSVIKASIELIKVKNISSESSNFLLKQISMIERAISRMSHQIEDVLDFVRPIPLQMARNSILTALKFSIEKAKMSKEISVQLPETDFEFEFDKDKIDVVFDNILTNASQAMTGKGVIHIRFSEESDLIKIEFEDSGSGVPEDVLPKIFEPLVTTKQTGTGLGLASCKSIIEQHGGSISVQNNPTTFVIYLPKNPKK